MNEQIEKAVKVLNEGGIIIFPTDTAFGIGCRIDKIQSIEKLFKIRKRPQTQATPVLINSLEMAGEYVQDIPAEVKEKLIDKYWPGALTIILKAKKEIVPSLVRGDGENIGIRMPNNDVALEIIKRIGVPLLGPSANFHGENTPYDFKDLDKDLIKLVDFVIDGKCLVKNSSTVIDCTKTPWEILRNGAIQINI
jgi:L-threonylcarbamoyladenylate synthase